MSQANEFFTSDHHFSHENIIRYCKRPFSSAEEMDEKLIALWNETVGPDDIVWYLGDFAMKAHPKQMRSIFDRLNGRKRLIIGNHDNGATFSLPWDEPPAHYREISIEKTKVVLCHYGMRTWNGQFRESCMLYGHSHGRLPGNAHSLDVGVDCWDYRPASWEQVQKRLASLPASFPSVGEIEDN